MNHEEIKKLTREELEQEVFRLNRKYVWGIQVSDIASCVQRRDVGEPFEDKNSILSNEQLHNELFQRLVEFEDFAIYDWTEDVREAILGFSKKTNALLFEYQKREFSRPRGEI